MYKKKFIKTLDIMSRESKKISWCSRNKCHSLVNDYQINHSLYDYCKNFLTDYFWMLRGGYLEGVFDPKFSAIKIERKHIGYDNLAIFPEFLYENEAKLSKISQTILED